MSAHSSDSGNTSLHNISEILAKKKRSKEYLQTAPTKKYANYYNMTHLNRGKALIFNHELFINNKLPRRTESKIDCDNLSKILKQLDFDVKIYDNLNYKEIVRTLEKVAKDDHSDEDCLLIAILTYGNWDLLHARDKYYKSEIIWTNFSADKCPTLAEKPKLIFIQGCQNDESNKIFLKERTITDDGGKEFRIPTQADFLIFFSSNSLNMKVEQRKCKVEKNLLENTSCQEMVTDGNNLAGCFCVDTHSDEEIFIDEKISSELEKTNGSLFIQSLCRQLRENGTIYDIQTILTYTIQLIISEYEKQNGKEIKEEKFEVPYIVTMLTRLLQFNTKIKRSLPK
ncbi:caspase-1-like [Leptopilina boulardi]|uniref:caspase-1-like n=1 Tax=Leptopilina boulardi TaxID=63433 RepID=UPI0021F558AD|nr:caspase-1-like [Leptopilina boulardi]